MFLKVRNDDDFDAFLETWIAGGLAQLGERLHGMQEVRGSSPLSSIFGVAEIESRLEKVREKKEFET